MIYTNKFCTIRKRKRYLFHWKECFEKSYVFLMKFPLFWKVTSRQWILEIVEFLNNINKPSSSSSIWMETRTTTPIGRETHSLGHFVWTQALFILLWETVHSFLQLAALIELFNERYRLSLLFMLLTLMVRHAYIHLVRFCLLWKFTEMRTEASLTHSNFLVFS
jgi:hypothetical protein